LPSNAWNGRSDVIQTEFPFTLPVGYQDGDGTLHRDGTMRMATAADEILPVRDARVQGNEAYHVVVLLSRVITRLGSLDQVNPKVIEGLYVADMAHLQDLYNEVNTVGRPHVAAHCPNCDSDFDLEVDRLGGSSATPFDSSTRR
jgi:hypothetical protein